MLPPDTYRPGQVIDKKSVGQIFGDLAANHADDYKTISHKAMLFGRDSAKMSGGGAFSIKHMATPKRAQARRDVLRQVISDILQTTPEAGRDRAIIDVLAAAQATDKDDTVAEAEEEDNPFALMLKGAGRGNPASVARLISSDMMYADAAGRPIAIPVLNSYSRGLTPGEYVASTFGVRKGLVEAKLGVGTGGYAAKLLLAAAHRMVVTDDDAPPELEGLSAGRGLPVDTDDTDNIGALLATDTGPYPRNTTITPKILAHLKKLKHDEILVRSPLTSSDPAGGVYAKDVGFREQNRLPEIGESVGITAAGAVSEPVTQSLLCLAEGTLVRMADMSTKAIEQIRRGDWVLGSDRYGNAFPVRVTRRYVNGNRECVETVYRFKARKDDLPLRSTVDHKILQTRVTTGQKSDAVNHLPIVAPVNLPGHKIYAIPVQSTQIVATGGPGKAMAFIVGFLVGDGCYTEKTAGKWGSGGFSCADPSLIEAIRQISAPLGLSPKFHLGSECYWRLTMDEQTIDFRHATNGQVGKGTRHPVKAWMESQGMWYKYAHEKTLPDDVLRWDDESLRGLLQGLLASDGTVYDVETSGKWSKKPHQAVHIGFGCTSKKLVEQIRTLFICRLNCYVGNIYEATNGRKRPMYNFTITHIGQVRRVLAFLGDIPGVRGKKLMDGIAQSGRGRQQHEHYFARRKSMKPLGMVPTYDIEVDHPDHLFVLANGLIVSNSSKHKGGLAEEESDELTGFALIDRLINTPKEFREAATHTEVDGKVETIKPAEQGGSYVTVAGQQYYASPNAKITVKPGDEVEAGDMLTGGTPNPRMVIRHKGLGEGGRQLVKSLHKAIGKDAHRRNVELIVRGLVDRVRVTEEFDDYAPEDVVPYSEVMSRWQPREGHSVDGLHHIRGKYLEQPVLHYSVGTRITPSVTKMLQKHNVQQITTHNSPPPFEPETVRATDILRTDQDWMTRQVGTGLEKGLLESAHRGRISDEDSTSFVPSRARAVDFGRVGKVQLSPPKPSSLPNLGYQ